MCSVDTAVASDSQDDGDAEQSIEMDNMIDAVYEDESDDEVNY